MTHLIGILIDFTYY